MALSVEDIESYLDRYGWTFSSGGHGVLCTGWAGESRSYPLVLTLTDTLLSFSVAPLLRLGAHWGTNPEVAFRLLELNHDCQLVKLGIDEYGDLTLSAQLLTSCLEFSSFSDYLGVIGYYSDKVYDCLEVELEGSEHFLECPDEVITQ